MLQDNIWIEVGEGLLAIFLFSMARLFVKKYVLPCVMPYFMAYIWRPILTYLPILVRNPTKSSSVQADKLVQDTEVSAPTFAINKHRNISTPGLAPVIGLKSKKSIIEDTLPSMTASKTQFSKPESRVST